MSFSQGHALIIGVGSHQYAANLDVPATAADAQAVAGLLCDPHFCGYPSGQVTLLQNQSATTAAVLSALDSLAQQAGPQDTVLIFYSGHGDYAVDGSYTLISHDAQFDGFQVAAGSGLPQARLLEKIRTIQAERILLIFNACHSGQISPVLGAANDLGSKNLPNTAADALLGSGSGRMIISACKEEQFSYVGPGTLTLFTQALVDALHGKDIIPRGGFINAYDVYLAIYEAISETVKDRFNAQQEPVLHVIQGVGPFAVSLFRGATATDLQASEIGQGVALQGGALRQVKPEKAQRAYQQVILQSGGITMGQNNRITINGPAIGTLEGAYIDNSRKINTAGGAYIEGDFVQGDKVSGDKISIGSISGKNVAVGAGAQIFSNPPQTGSASSARQQFNASLSALRPVLLASGIPESVRLSIESSLGIIEAQARLPHPTGAIIEMQLGNISQLLESAANTAGSARIPAEVVWQLTELARQAF
jgi:hypothetical protein